MSLRESSVDASVDQRCSPGASKFGVWTGAVLLMSVVLVSTFVGARTKDKLSYGEGVIVNIPMPEAEVTQVVQDVAQNGVIRGTKEYNKDEFVSGAQAANSSRVFPAWTEGGKVFYKVREHALDPRNFKDGGDVGTLVVRYIVQPQGDKNTVLRINALFEEEFRHTAHQSDGSVETSEYKDIHEHLEAIEVMKKQNAEAERERQEQLVKKQYLAMGVAEMSSSRPQEHVQPVLQDNSNTASQAMAPASSEPAPNTPSRGQVLPGQSLPGQSLPGQSLEDHVKDLRKQVERLVKAPGAPLKSAPFHTASTLQLLSPGTEVLILINTPYWYGVETHEGQHGWMQRDQLEQP